MVKKDLCKSKNKKILIFSHTLTHIHYRCYRDQRSVDRCHPCSCETVDTCHPCSCGTAAEWRINHLQSFASMQIRFVVCTFIRHHVRLLWWKQSILKRSHTLGLGMGQLNSKLVTDIIIFH